MSINIFYDPATVVSGTANPRAWTVGPVTVFKDGVKVIDAQTVTFPDILGTWRDAGYITQSEINDWIFEMTLKGARKRFGVDS